MKEKVQIGTVIPSHADPYLKQEFDAVGLPVGSEGRRICTGLSCENTAGRKNALAEAGVPEGIVPTVVDGSRYPVLERQLSKET
ncbi:hypothetical protein [Mesotoga sp.]|uniref:hypothetical protein n=1 Tax=Mesotoga sp. TaxID=2053577 RepID=UPI00345EFC0F